MWVKRLYDAVGYNSLVRAVRFQDLLQQLEFLLIYTYCTSSDRRAIYFWKQDSHKVAVELPNIIEGLVGVQLCTLFLLQICLTDGSANTTSASGIVPTVWWYYNEIHFSICILTLTITVLQRFR